ncbi:morphogenetic protein [Klebsiella pneumoniae]|uniref:Morphogenetic protein n=1 Tax=Klebsiella pneumoniae TaxID=573 RepID=A0A2X3EH16_KLEPN|nr:morphogenetic protein [Klebsiella pneumoniae]HDU1553610.1 morphogenetic protein [Klebsiella pneumoniae]
MTERGMIFNGEMVRAIIDGRKTQTRRPVKFPVHDKNLGCELAGNELAGELSAGNYLNSAFGKPGDRIWVRETWARYNIDQNSHDIAYRATTPADWPEEGRWRPSIHMPRWASRILLEITDVRVERLNVISEEDARAEGVGIAVWFAAKGVTESEWTSLGEQGAMQASHINKFATLWESIYGAESWKANSWVWVIEFKRVEGGAA